MTKQTFEITNEELRIINVVKAVMDIKNIPEAVKYIIKDYADTKSYSKFIKEKRGNKK
jgi:DNA polymerase/3'-5' exonuclease PolX